MPNLALIQEAFSQALLAARDPLPKSARGGGRRTAIYRNNMAAGLVSGLAARFPTVSRLVGEEFFGEMARAYVDAEPPRSPTMMYYGETFPDFITAYAPAAPVPYLGAVARIETARALAYHAADAGALGVDDFAAVPACDLGNLRVTLHPSVSIVTSPYPVYSIWKINQDRAPIVPVSPWAPEAALIARPFCTVEVHGLRPGEAAFLRALAGHGPFSAAVEAGLHDAETFDPAKAVGLLIHSGIVVGLGDHAAGPRSN